MRPPAERPRPSAARLPGWLAAGPLALTLVGQGLGVVWRGGFGGWRGLALGAALLGGLLLWHHGRCRRTGRPAPRLRWLLALCLPFALWLTAVDLMLIQTSVLARGLVGVTALAMGQLLLLLFALAPSPPAWLWRVGLRVSLTVTTAVGLLFLVEVAFTAVLPAHPYDVIPDERRMGELMVPGVERRLSLQPGFRGTYMHPEFPGLRVEINDLGMRDALDEGPPAPGEASVLCVGDSFVFGTGVEMEETYPWLLEEHLSSALGRPVQVYGAGVPGYGINDCLAQLRQLGPLLRPDVVVLAVQQSNDYSDNLQFHNSKVRRAQEEAGLARTSRRRSNVPTVPVFLQRIAHWQYWLGASALLIQARPVLEEPMVELGWIRPFVASNRFLSAMLSEDPTPVTIMAFQEMMRSTEEFRAACEELGSRLVMLVIPAAIQAEPDRFATFVASRKAVERPHLKRELLHRTLVQELRRLGVPVLDLFPVLEAECLAGRTGYHREAHFNRHGHELAEQMLRPVVTELLESN